jgi:hypothetical protein
MSWWWNDRGHVRSGRGSRAPVDCARSHPSHWREWVVQLGPPWLPILSKGSTCPSGEAQIHRGGQVLLMTPWGLERGRTILPEAPISPETFPQGSGGMEFVVRASSD